MTGVDEVGDPERFALAQSIFEPSPLATVADAVSAASEDERRIYVERIGDSWRWSLTHPGGPYPLLRISARFLRIDYHRLMVGCRYPADEICVLAKDLTSEPLADAWAVIEFDGPTAPEDVKRRIWRAFGPGGTASAPTPKGDSDTRDGAAT